MVIVVTKRIFSGDAPMNTEINFIQTSLIALIGGLLGVLWMVPLRRALVVKTDLPFPEGIAVAAVLTTTVVDDTSPSKHFSPPCPWHYAAVHPR